MGYLELLINCTPLSTGRTERDTFLPVDPRFTHHLGPWLAIIHRRVNFHHKTECRRCYDISVVKSNLWARGLHFGTEGISRFICTESTDVGHKFHHVTGIFMPSLHLTKFLSFSNQHHFLVSASSRQALASQSHSISLLPYLVCST